jgi:hypothetical protein
MTDGGTGATTGVFEQADSTIADSAVREIERSLNFTGRPPT